MRIFNLTLNGADDRTDIDRMAEFSRSYPFVEWGVLIDDSVGPKSRYPSLRWKRKLANVAMKTPRMKVSAHLCGGKSVGDFFQHGDMPFRKNNMGLIRALSRIQLNVVRLKYSDVTTVAFENAAHELRDRGIRLVVQRSRRSPTLKRGIIVRPVAPIDFLIDDSCGTGSLMRFPPVSPCPSFYFTSYGGGISPHTIENVLYELDKVVPLDRTIGLDVETGIRTDDVLDFDKIKQIIDALIFSKVAVVDV